MLSRSATLLTKGVNHSLTSGLTSSNLVGRRCFNLSSFNNSHTKLSNSLNSNRLNLSLYNKKFFSSEAESSSKNEVKDAETVPEQAPASTTADTASDASSTTAKTEVKEAEVKENLGKFTEKPVGEAQSLEFQAETRKLLDIVARSLYTDKEVFVRELISNASDATEKVRHIQLVGQPISDSHLELEINLFADSSKKTLTIQDHGIGMKKEELIKNLGSIGFSGSLEYIKNAKDSKDLSSIIGQFGVGFYSSFMVGDKVTVYSKHADPDAKGYCWTYEGSGSYNIREAEGVERGTKIVIELNDKSDKFSQRDLIEKIIQKYSNFVGFPIKLNGKQVNTLKPLWTMSKGEVTEKDHKEFYQFISHSYDNPYMHLHFTTDSPLNIRALFYIGEHSGERFGMGRMEAGINLFSRKVLIQAKSKGILPEWLRFVKGVVDSEDIPLNLSREHLQDSQLIQRINTVLTKRILKWLDDESRRDPDKYVKFFNEFGDYLREGLFAEAPYREEIGKLLRFESSHLEAGKVTSFEEYLSRMPPDQKDVYYVVVPNRQLAESSPYMESFKSKGVEVLYSYNTRFDDYALGALVDYKKKPITSIESSKANSAMKDDKDKDENAARLNSEDTKELIKWMKDILGSRVTTIKESDRLVDSPAIITEHESAAFRRMVRFVDPNRAPELPKQHLEINPKHEIVIKLSAIRNDKPNLAKIIAEQVFDDALIAAGLLDDSRPMIPRLNRLMTTALLADKDVEALPVTASATKEKKSKKADDKKEDDKDDKDSKDEKSTKEDKKEKKAKKEKKEKKHDKDDEHDKSDKHTSSTQSEAPKADAPKAEAPKADTKAAETKSDAASSSETKTA